VPIKLVRPFSPQLLQVRQQKSSGPDQAKSASIFDETAEYMRIHLALSAGKRVSFADTTGGDLVDVKEFVAFDSDEEEGSAKWEEEEAKYRKPEREPTYSVHPEFIAATGGALLQAVRTNKVEVEQMSPVEDEPLAFKVLIRVLNISFHKSVYIRTTMDHWVTYFDHPAEYVQGSNDGDTDQFSLKLSFSPPYLTHGSRIEFVVRYETSDGDYWANNSSMNYVITLLLKCLNDVINQVRSVAPCWMFHIGFTFQTWRLRASFICSLCFRAKIAQEITTMI
uniref:CBM21 domain-containing protein n=1 Tax=Stegastes partitus TaxID=144197 RepID=A0A3B5AU68_9TELE